MSGIGEDRTQRETPTKLRFDPYVWSGRALQENFADLAGAVLHQCIRPLIRAELLAGMDISARAISLAERPQDGQTGHQCWHAPGRPNLHLVSSSRRPRQVTVNSSRRLSG